MENEDLDASLATRSAWSGVAGVAIALGFTEMFAGISDAIPSAISAIGAVIVDISPGWLQSFAISTFGTADKAVLAVGTFIIAMIIGWVLGRSSTRSSAPILLGFLAFSVLGISAQLGEVGARTWIVTASTLTASSIGLLVWRGIREWSAPREQSRTEGSAPSIERRRFLLALAATLTVTVLTVSIGRARIRSRAEAHRAALVLPEPVEIAFDPTSENYLGLPGVTPIVVPNAEFYRIDTALVVPTIDPQEWTLTVKGMVDEEVTLTYEALLSMELIEQYTTLACVSNEVGGRYVGNALWTGVRLTDVLELAGVRDGADQIVGRSIDDWTAGFPTEVAFDGRGCLVAVGMNREVLPADHGFPARLVVPGLYGYVSATKWLTEIELTTWDAFDGFWIPRGWAKKGPVKTQSRIDRPKNNTTINAGRYTFGGVAWAPNVGIERVEVQIDEGPWREADLSVPLSVESWVQWGYTTELTEGEHRIRVRATDSTGFMQSEQPVSSRPDGAEGYHTIRVHTQ